MRCISRYIRWWMGSMMMLLLMVACSSSESDESQPQPKDKPVLKLYVFAPDHPIVTRGDGSEIDASTEENAIHSLHVWVFEHNDLHTPVGHVSLNDVTLSETGSEVLMDITDEFADADPKPRVDVFVAANVTVSNCGQSIEGSQSWDALDGYVIESYFGAQPSYRVTSVPSDGLPMSGVLKDQSVSGTAPVYQVTNEEGGLAIAKLVRAVSKMRFVFCKSSNNMDNVTIKEIKLDADVLPTQEHLFLAKAYSEDEAKCRVNSTYEDGASLVTPPANTIIRGNDSPNHYSYNPTVYPTSLDYEREINQGIADEKLTELGTFYLRECAGKLSGTIEYKINDEVRTKTFQMTEIGDFTRNHTWIVYGYFVSSGDLEVNAVEIKDWHDTEQGEDIYNW